MEISAVNGSQNICFIAQNGHKANAAAQTSSFVEPQDTAEISQAALSLNSGATTAIQEYLSSNSDAIAASMEALASGVEFS